MWITIKAGVLLFLLGFGYLVFLKANREEASVKTVGRAIGIAIISCALIGTVLLTLKAFTIGGYKKGSFHKKAMRCMPKR